MLSLLRIRDFALIEELTIELGEGLNILTGETGAGKSVIINALSLVLGEKARSEDIRSGAEKAVAEAVFETKKGEFLIKREITPLGRGRCFVNGDLVPLSRLKEIGEDLVDIHGQHAHQSLLNPANHIDLLDGLGGLGPLRQEVAQEFGNYLSFKRELERLERELQDRERRIDLLRFQIDEIEGANFQLEEEERLLYERTLLRNAEILFHSSDEAYRLLNEDEIELPSIHTKLSAILPNLRRLAEIDEKTKPLLEQTESLLLQVEDLSFGLRDYRDRIEFSPERLLAIEERLSVLERIKRKYGGSLKEALSCLDSFKKEFLGLEHSEERLQDLAKKIKEVGFSLVEKSLSLSEKSKQVAAGLEQRVREELRHLGMKDALLKVDIRPKEGGEGVEGRDGTLIVDSKGCDQIELMISVNPGEELKSLAKIASGGELSRIMLALKGILAKVDEIPLLVFDEIDVGIGGRIAQVVGERLSKLSKDHQIICITHLPQIASLADLHFKVEKRLNRGRTTIQINPLKPEERIEEIARMIGGKKVTESTLKTAREMLRA